MAKCTPFIQQQWHEKFVQFTGTSLVEPICLSTIYTYTMICRCLSRQNTSHRPRESRDHSTQGAWVKPISGVEKQKKKVEFSLSFTDLCGVIKDDFIYKKNKKVIFQIY